MSIPIGGSGYTVGQTASFAVAPSDPSWVPCRGQQLTRASYPKYSLLNPVGTFTSTQRTLAGSASTILPDVVAGSSTFLATGVYGVQASLDGITWVGSSGPTEPLIGTLWDGSRFIALSSNVNNMWVSPDAGNATTMANLANWTAISVSGYGPRALHQSAHSVNASASLFVYTTHFTVIADGSNAPTVYTAPFTANAVCATGQGFLIQTTTDQMLAKSTTGLSGSWTTYYIPHSTYMSGSPTGIVSDGSGTVLIWYYDADASFTGSGGPHLIVSHDHGSTFGEVMLPEFDIANPSAQISNISYANGRFMLSLGGGYVYLSTTGDTWILEGIGRDGIPNTNLTSFAYLSGTYVGISASTTSITSTEDTTNIRVPRSGRNVGTMQIAGSGVTGTNQLIGAGPSFEQYLKVA